MPGQTQLANEEMVELLKPYFRARNEPNKAFADAVSMYLALPALRGFWPFSSVNSIPEAIDLGASGFDLSRNGTPTVSRWNLAPLTVLDGSGDCWHHADHAQFDILATETYVQAAVRGLTLGAWVYPKDVTTESRDIISKWHVAVAADQSYTLHHSFANTAMQFTFRDNALNSDFVTSTSSSPIDNWYFVVARLQPATPDITIWVNDEITTKVTIRVDVRNGTADFVVGARDGLTTNEWDGYIAFPFITASSLHDAQVFTLFEQTRRMFGI